MKKRFLALFTTLAILSSFSINFVFATSVSGNVTTPEVSGETVLPPAVSSGDVTISGDTSTNTPGDISGETSGEISGEVITVTAYDESLTIDRNTILTSNFRAESTIEGSTLTYLVETQPSHGTLVHTDVSNKSFTYTPDLDYVGTDSFTFKVSDGTIGAQSGK